MKNAGRRGGGVMESTLPRSSHLVSEIELVDESGASSQVNGGGSLASSTGPDVRAHAVASSNSAAQRSSDASTSFKGEPGLYKKVLYVPGISPFPHFPTGSKATAETDDGAGFCCCCLPGDAGLDGASGGVSKPEASHTGTRKSDGQQEAEQEQEEGQEGEILRGFGAYWREWVMGLQSRTLYVGVLLVWAGLVPALVFGTWMGRKTGGAIGTAEVFMSTLVCGVLFAVFGREPLVIVGVTAPSAVFVAAVASTANRLSVGFVPWLAWIGIWCAGSLMILAAAHASRAAAHLSRFSWEVLQAFVGLTLLWDGTQLVVELFRPGAPLDAAILSLWLATCTVVLATFLSGAAGWQYLNRGCLEAIQFLGPALTMILFTALPLLPLLSQPQLLRVEMPDLPYHNNRVSKFGAVVSLRALPLWTIFLAFIPGSLLAGLIFFDHNASSLLVQDAKGRREYNYRSRSWDMFVIAVSVLLCSFFGLPFSYGLSIQSVSHAQALACKTDACDPESQEKPASRSHYQRVSATIVALSSGLLLLPGLVHLVRKIPQGVIAGLCLQVALSCLKDLKLVERIKWLFVDSVKNPSAAEGCNLTVRVYSIVQVSCIVTIFAVSKTAAALLFPLFLLVTVWLRHDVLHNFFSKREFLTIDKRLLTADIFDGTTASHPTAGKTSRRLRKGGPHSLRKLLRDRVGVSGLAGASKLHMQLDSESARSCESPALLAMASKRRLKERSRRRNKRKMSHGASSFETTSSSTFTLPLQPTDMMKKKQKSSAQNFRPKGTPHHVGSRFGRQQATQKSKRQQGKGLGTKDAPRGTVSLVPGTGLGPFGDNSYLPSSQVNFSPKSKPIQEKADVRTPRSRPMVNFKPETSSPFHQFSPKMEIPLPTNISVLRRTLPSPFRQVSPKSQMLHANSLFDPHWKDSSPPNKSMQVHENLAFTESMSGLTGEGQAARSSSVQQIAERKKAVPSPRKSPLTLRFSAPLLANQPMLQDLQRPWEMSSSAWTRSALPDQLRASSFRLCGDALSSTGGSEILTLTLATTDMLANGGNELSNTEDWKDGSYVQPYEQGVSSTADPPRREAGRSERRTLSASSVTSGDHLLDPEEKGSTMVHGWEAVTHPPAEVQPSRFKLASEVLYGETSGSSFHSLETASNGILRLRREDENRALLSRSWEEVNYSPHEDFADTSSSSHPQAADEPWVSQPPNSRPKRKPGSGNESQQGTQSSTGLQQQDQRHPPSSKPLQWTPERSTRNTRLRSSSSEFTDHFEELGASKQHKQQKLPKSPPVWR